MPSLNKIQLIGNFGRDPESRVTPKGTTITAFSLAINRQWKSDSGEKNEEVTWFDCEAWGKIGETIAKYCKKGHCIYVEGRGKNESWEDKKTQEKKTRFKVVVENFQFITGSSDERSERPAPADRPASSTPPPAQSSNPPPKRPMPEAGPDGSVKLTSEEKLDEDVPF